ncbi:MAG: hypothetical protein Q8861_00375 [Bacteroidota bacterium]|nr:hypothetical protein [Bacteroidota bacterium]MDP4268536.1 hypothetical protein [Bacteroidota bacterium]
MQNYNNFKLLAIRPLKGCNRRFLKNLTAGQIYALYNSCSFFNKDLQPITNLFDNIEYISENTTIPENLYDIRTADGQKLKINISAIAGKNGSGKSTLIEFLFATIYLFSVSNNILTPNLESLNKHIANLESETTDLSRQLSKLAQKKQKIVSLLKQKNKEISAQVLFDQLKVQFITYLKHEEELKLRKDYITKEKKGIKRKRNEIIKFGNELKAEIYFEINREFFCMILDYDAASESPVNKIIRIKHVNSTAKAIKCTDDINIRLSDLSKHFFYTIAVNYSHYALNSFYLGDWINALFHKNDGYTTPLVINPMRTNGDFEINSEINFARYRLLTNVLKENISSKKSDNKVYITENQYIYKVKLSLNRDKVNKIPKIIRFKGNQISSNDARSYNLFETFISGYLSDNEQSLLLSKDFPLKEIIVNYILHKVEKIARIYPWFGNGYQFSESTPFIENEKFFNSLKTDGSHITYKLKQAIYFLKYCLNSKEGGDFHVKKGQLENNTKIQFEFSLEELMSWMDYPALPDIIRFLPPAIFDIDFELSNDLGSQSLFNELSSGEQQLIHTIQSVIYHLNNLQSAHLGASQRIKYEYVNIIYDEIELYFHPDYQRRFISDLLKAIGRIYMEKNDRIKAINILLLTHSPFILSDIPVENIMLLDLDKKTKRSIPRKAESQTFAANINELLANSFFLNGTLMGSFAESKIRTFIENIKEKREFTEEDEKLLEMVGDSFLKSSLKNFLDSER